MYGQTLHAQHLCDPCCFHMCNTANSYCCRLSVWLLLQTLEPITDTTLARSQSDGPLSDIPAIRQEVSADEQAAPKGRDSSGDGSVQSGLQGTTNMLAFSDLVAVSHLHKENAERFDEITQALEQDLRNNPKSSNLSMRGGNTHHYGIYYGSYTHSRVACSSKSPDMRSLQHNLLCPCSAALSAPL